MYLLCVPETVNSLNQTDATWFKISTRRWRAVTCYGCKMARYRTRPSKEMIIDKMIKAGMYAQVSN